MTTGTLFPVFRPIQPGHPSLRQIGPARTGSREKRVPSIVKVSRQLGCLIRPFFMSDFQQNADLIELLAKVANLATKSMEMAGNGRSGKICGLIGQENSTIH